MWLARRGFFRSGDARRALRHRGYLVLDEPETAATLSCLRRHCDAAMQQRGAPRESGQQDAASVRFLAGMASSSADLAKFVAREQARTILECLSVAPIVLYHEQFVVKPPGGGEVGWHCDSAYEDFPHDPYLAIWTALDDVDERNGALAVGRLCTHEEALTHKGASNTNQRGGRLLPMAAGQSIVLSSSVLHRSGPNLGSRPRRAYVAFYCSGGMTAGGRRLDTGRVIVSDPR